VVTAAGEARLPATRGRVRGRAMLGVGAALLAGVASAAQSRVNGGLGSALHDGLAAALISNGSALLLLTIGLAVAGSARAGVRLAARDLRVGRLRPWEVLGGVFGALFVASQGLSVGALGVAVFTVAAVAGQAGGGLVVDRAGMAPGGKRPVTAARALGAGLAVCAVLVAVAGRLATPATIVATVLPLCAGAALAWQAAVNGRVRQATGNVLAAVFVNAAVGTAALVLAFAVSAAVRGWPAGTLPARPWLYLGGAIGVCFTAVCVAAVRHTGVLLLGLSVIAGQVTGAIAIDLAAPGGAGAPTGSTLLGAALTLAAVGIAARDSFPSMRRRSTRLPAGD